MTDDERRSPWAEIVGPCYTAASVARALRVRGSHDAVKRGAKRATAPLA